jgi:hypothetical protein
MNTILERAQEIASRVIHDAGIRAGADVVQVLPSNAALGRVVQLLERADGRWSDPTKVDRWACSPRGVLNGCCPAAMALRCEDGLRQSLNIIDRIDNGTYT